MSFPVRTLAINSKAEDFPTPVSPTSRIVYGVFALFFDVLMIPSLRDSRSLEQKVRIHVLKSIVETYLMVGMLSLSLELSASAGAFLRGLALLIESMEGTPPLEVPSRSVFTHGRNGAESLTAWAARLERRSTLTTPGYLERVVIAYVVAPGSDSFFSKTLRGLLW